MSSIEGHSVANFFSTKLRGNTPLLGADANIKKDFYHDTGFVLENTILPENKEKLPRLVVGMGPGRVGSTALVALMASHYLNIGSYYQAQKSLIRHGLDYGKFVIPEAEDEQQFVFVKDTSGPFDKQAEEFDPVGLLIQAGYPQELITFIPLLRNPLDIFKSNFKFEGGILPGMLVSNYLHTVNLYAKYSESAVKTIPLAYDLPGKVYREQGVNIGVEQVVEGLFKSIGLPYKGIAFDQQKLMPVGQGGVVHLGEALHPDEYSEIVGPTFKRGEYGYNIQKHAEPQDFTKISNPKNRDLVWEAQQINHELGHVYQQFLDISAQAILGINLN